jgi:crotonobetainyl-CoA:carnitine CoA-transferase CaiB-like acyl-CoA transferase
MIFNCKDGYVNFVIMAGRVGGRINRKLIEWMENDRICVDAIKDIRWESLDMIDFPKEMRDHFADLLQQFFAKHTKRELYEESTKRQLYLYPVFTMEDIVEDSQLKSRDFWEEIKHPELGTIIPYPRPCAKTPQFPLRNRSRPPQIGEHNREIYEQELGFSLEELTILMREGAI